jgi:hypothetical protein
MPLHGSLRTERANDGKMQVKVLPVQPMPRTGAKTMSRDPNELTEFEADAFHADFERQIATTRNIDTIGELAILHDEKAAYELAIEMDSPRDTQDEQAKLKKVNAEIAHIRDSVNGGK